MTFWNDSKLNPTRQFRFMVSNGTNWWWVSSCSKPSYQISTEEYKLINHKFKYPGVVTWNDVELSIVDTGKTAKVFYNALVYGGYGIDNQSIVFAINKNDEILYENKSLNIEELSKFIQSKNKKYILDLDKESSIYFFNRIMKEFKVKDIKKVFVKVIEKENDK